MSSNQDTDLRCPDTHGKLFARLNTTINAIEISCQNCRRAARLRVPSVQHVLHLYDADSGAFSSTVWVVSGVRTAAR